MKKTNMAITTKRRKDQKAVKRAIRKDTKKVPKRLATIKKPTKMNTPRRKNSTTKRIKRATTRNMAASTNIMNRRKANTRKASITSLTTIRHIKVKRDITRRATTMKITRDTKANMATKNTTSTKIITERKAARKVAVRKDTNPRDISDQQCNRKLFHTILLVNLLLKFVSRLRHHIVVSNFDAKIFQFSL